MYTKTAFQTYVITFGSSVSVLASCFLGIKEQYYFSNTINILLNIK
jgi:hypothetical protein